MALPFYSSIFPPPLGPTALTSAACNVFFYIHGFKVLGPMVLWSYSPNALLFYSSVSMALPFYSSIFPFPLGPTATTTLCSNSVLFPISFIAGTSGGPSIVEAMFNSCWINWA